MRFTVFGSTGFIGSHLVKKLRSEGFDVSEPDRNTLNTLDKNIGYVIYCIGMTADFREKPFETIEAHVCLLKEILQKYEFDSFVYLSSTRIYIHNFERTGEDDQIPVSVNDPYDIFNVSKLAGEILALNCGKKNVKIARLSNVYGSDFSSKNFITSILTDAITKGKITLRTTPDSAKDYISIDDAVNLLIKISIQGNKPVYNVATGNNIRNEEILEIIKQETGCQVDYSATPERIIFNPIKVDNVRHEFDFVPGTTLLREIPVLIRKFKEYSLKQSK